MALSHALLGWAKYSSMALQLKKHEKRNTR